MSSDTQIKYLADVPQYAPTLAQWTYDAWGKYDPTLTLENATSSLKQKLNKDKIPLAFVAISNDEPVGMVNLKSTIKPQGYEYRNLWLGSLWVAEGHRSQGVGTQLLEAAYKKAKELGFKKISVFESDPEMAIWYAENGWKQFATDEYQTHTIALLEHTL